MRVLLDTNVLFAAFVTHGVRAGLYEECLLQAEIIASTGSNYEASATSRLMKKSMKHKYSGAIPPTQLVVRSYSTYTRHSAQSKIPPTQLVDRSYPTLL